jgi:ketosteroid isomerase-like protein
MKNLITACSLLFAMFFLLSCTGKNKTSPITEEKTGMNSEDIKHTLTVLQKEEDRAEAEKDFTTLDKLLSKDIIIAIDGGNYFGRDTMYALLKKVIRNNQPYEDPKYDKINVAVSGNTAVMSYLVAFRSRDNEGKTSEEKFMNMVTWIKQDDQWQVLAVQSNFLKPVE